MFTQFPLSHAAFVAQADPFGRLALLPVHEAARQTLSTHFPLAQFELEEHDRPFAFPPSSPAFHELAWQTLPTQLLLSQSLLA